MILYTGAKMLKFMRISITGALLLFALCVQAQEPRVATITFNAPTKYVDGTDIAPGTVITYNLYQGECGASKSKVAEITETSTVVNTGLQPGKRYCWQVTAIANGVESDLSNEGDKEFPWPAPEPVVITVE